jgi:processing peptidase subunit alpha
VFSKQIHCLETMAFGPTKSYGGLEITHLLQDWGATRFVSHSREQTLHCIDILRPNVQQGMNILSDVVLNPLISELPVEVEYAKEIMEFQAQEQMPELVLGEAVQVAAYGSDQQLGKLHFATPESIPYLNAPLMEDFYQKNILNNPGGMVIAGAGIDHEVLVEMSKQHFGVMEQKSAPTTIPSTYRGGYHLIENHSTSTIYTQILPEEEQCRVALAFPVGGWHSDTMVTACVLQSLLGGGSSFSAGGPGKGMYSRMYQQVLNRYGWMETAEAFTTFADEGGLFGVSASTAYAENVSELVTILADQLARVAVQPVGDVELSRARNMLKCNVLTQLESRLILFEDMGRQVLTYGKREDAATTCRKIESVTAEDIQKLAQEMLQSHKPTLAATGSHLEKIPRYEDVCQWFR